jgi:hypothetical protein
MDLTEGSGGFPLDLSTHAPSLKRAPINFAALCSFASVLALLSLLCIAPTANEQITKSGSLQLPSLPLPHSTYFLNVSNVEMIAESV